MVSTLARAVCEFWKSAFKPFYISFNNGSTTLTDLIEVERVLSRHGTVKSTLEERGPERLEASLSSASVPLAHPRHSRVHTLAAVHVLHGSLPEEEKHELPVVKGVHEIRGCVGENKKLSVSLQNSFLKGFLN